MGWSDSLETKRNVWGQKVLVGETLGQVLCHQSTQAL